MATHEHGRDHDLVTAARNGNKDALARLLARYRPLLLAVCRRALGDAALAEDAVQEACLQALLSLDRLRQPERFRSWLVGIGLNCCHRLRRQRMREAWSWEAMLGGQRLPDVVDVSPGPEAEAEAGELRAWIEHTVAGLPPGQRSAVLLHYLAGLTQAETAEALGVEVGAVKTRLHKARANLRRALWPHAAPELSAMGGSSMVTEKNLVEMRLTDVRRLRTADGEAARHLVVLEEVGGARSLPIWIGEFEATALALHLANVPHPRPMTYAFAAEILRASGGELREVRIDRLEGDVFYATAVIAGPEGDHNIDARPSDALNLALLLGRPIRARAKVLAATADCPDERWLQRETLTDGAAVIAGQVVAEWDEAADPPATDDQPV